jgi:hypothetical protein
MVQDGPFAPVEFRRKSGDGRITLVLDPEAVPVRLLWAHVLLTDLKDAKRALADREGLTAGDWQKHIGGWRAGEPTPNMIPDLPEWAKTRGLDAVIWTALEPKLDTVSSPSAEQIISYLRSLAGPKRDLAERYIRCTPRQIDTEYRHQIEAALGWSYRPC